MGFDSFLRGAECVRAISQSGLNPANCRLLDAGEAHMTMAGDGSRALLVLGFESTDHPVEGPMARALELCREHGGAVAESGGRGGRGGSDAVSSWREAFLGAPYVRDALVAMGVLAETFETAITWERFAAFHERVSAAAEQAVRLQAGATGRVFCRITHVYPDGPAPYFTVLAPARRGEEVEQWAAIKRAVSEAIIAEGGTITHHHAVGRDHRPWYDRQRPQPFAEALRGAKAAIDPAAHHEPRRADRPAAMRIAVLGPGGVGGLLAGALERAGTHDVVVVARESTAAVISEQGLRVQSVSLGEFVAHPRVVDRLTEPVDVLIVATKAAGLSSALERIATRAHARAASAQRSRSHRAAARALRGRLGRRRARSASRPTARSRGSSSTPAPSC